MHWHKAIICYSKHKNLIHHNLGMSHHPSHITRHMSLWVIDPTVTCNYISPSGPKIFVDLINKIIRIPTFDERYNNVQCSPLDVDDTEEYYVTRDI